MFAPRQAAVILDGAGCDGALDWAYRVDHGIQSGVALRLHRLPRTPQTAASLGTILRQKPQSGLKKTNETGCPRNCANDLRSPERSGNSKAGASLRGHAHFMQR